MRHLLLLCKKPPVWLLGLACFQGAFPVTGFTGVAGHGFQGECQRLRGKMENQASLSQVRLWGQAFPSFWILTQGWANPCIAIFFPRPSFCQSSSRDLIRPTWEVLMKNLAKIPCSDVPALWLMVIPAYVLCRGYFFVGAECTQSPSFMFGFYPN